jgi:hypothetical protein
MTIGSKTSDAADTKEADKPPTAEEIAAADEAAALAQATQVLIRDINSDEPLRMSQDAYYGIVATARRFNADDGELAAVQSELDRVFGQGKIKAADITTPPEVAPKKTT